MSIPRLKYQPKTLCLCRDYFSIILFTFSRKFDDWAQASHSGEINVPLANKQLKQSDLAGELGKVIAERSKIRSSDDDITVFDSTGLAIQDLVTAWHVYQLLIKNQKDNLQPFDLFA